jgi:hypothetical protein
MTNEPMLEGLVKVKGHNFEDVVNLLDQLQVDHEISVNPGQARRHIRYSGISVPQKEYNRGEDYRRILGHLDGSCAEDHGNHIIVKAFYDVDPTFDMRRLDGTLTFAEGRLVEMVEISEKYPFYKDEVERQKAVEEEGERLAGTVWPQDIRSG